MAHTWLGPTARDGTRTMLIHPYHCRGKDFWYGFWHCSGSKHSLSRSRHQLHKQCSVSAQQVCALCLQWAGSPMHLAVPYRSAPSSCRHPACRQGHAQSCSAAAPGVRFSPVPGCAGAVWGRAEEALAVCLVLPLTRDTCQSLCSPVLMCLSKKACTLSQSYAAMIHPLQEFELKAKVLTTKRSFNLQTGGRGMHEPSADALRAVIMHRQDRLCPTRHDFPFWRSIKIPQRAAEPQ